MLMKAVEARKKAEVCMWKKNWLKKKNLDSVLIKFEIFLHLRDYFGSSSPLHVRFYFFFFKLHSISYTSPSRFHVRFGRLFLSTSHALSLFLSQERERLKQEKRDEKRLNKERKLELRRLELEMLREMRKPNEDMCLTDHKVNSLVCPGVCDKHTHTHTHRNTQSPDIQS